MGDIRETVEEGGGSIRARRHAIPPAPVWPRKEEGVLRDVGGALGLLLWQRVRDVRLWARVPPEDRRGLWAPPDELEHERMAYAGIDEPGLMEPLVVLASMVRFPDLAAGEEIAAACLRISAWGEASGASETSVQFAEAAAAAAPAHATAAVTAGRACRRVGASERAASWYRRAIPLAWRGRDLETYVRAQLGYGFVLFTMGRFDKARAHYKRAARVASWAGRYAVAAEAQHDLLTIASDTGRYRDGTAHAKEALELYSQKHGRVPYLVHDYAYLLICNGFFGSAVPLLEAVLGYIVQPRERVLVMGNLARCVAALGDRKRFDSAVGEVLRLAAQSEEFAAAALLHVAEGAHALGEWDRAESLATHALEVATRLGHETPRQRAAALLERTARREPGDAALEPPNPGEVRELTAVLLSRLSRIGAAGDGGGEDRGGPPGQ
jgi:tetratricopeptide (TPR) repeat protein